MQKIFLTVDIETAMIFTYDNKLFHLPSDIRKLCRFT